MHSLEAYITQRISLSEKDLDLLKRVSTSTFLAPKSILIQEGGKADFLYFLNQGITRGFKNKDGKIVVEHLVGEGAFLTSMEAFFQAAPSTDTFETLTNCQLTQIAKVDLDLLVQTHPAWSQLIAAITQESLQCKMERITDFQTLTAKERYVKFVEQHPDLNLQVSIENIASFLGMEPQSLSRIRKQLTI